MQTKQANSAFNKQVVLLGKEEDGTLVWLEFPSWDCNWYWGFGYLESYTNNTNPSKAKDINAHTHFEGLEVYNGKEDNTRCITSFVVSKEELNILVDSFKLFYSLKEEAGKNHRSNPEIWKRLNTIEIPKIMESILKMLHPSPNEVKFTIPTIE